MMKIILRWLHITFMILWRNDAKEQPMGQKDITEKGGTMRLGAYPCLLK